MSRFATKLVSLSLGGSLSSDSIPRQTRANSQRISILTTQGYLFGAPPKDRNQLPFGIHSAHFLDASGETGELQLPPGEYAIVATRGPEFSKYQQRVTVRSGETTRVETTVVRVVETPGFVSADYHVHLINSFDSFVTPDERIRTMVAEGVEYFAATEHDVVSDLSADIAALGLGEYVTSVAASEVSTFNVGHFNNWPAVVDESSRLGGSLDWGRAGVEAGGDYPSAGSYDLSPAEILPELAGMLDENFVDGVVQINHFNSPTLGYFELTGIDTGLVPPQSSTDPSLLRQDPAITNFYSDDYTVLELWIEANEFQDDIFFGGNLGDWFNLLNQGIVRTGTANSDTHHSLALQAGGPRTFVASSTDEPASLDHGELAANLNDGRAIGSSAPFVEVRVVGDDQAVAGLALGEATMVAATSGSATLQLRVQSPRWAEFDRIEVFLNTISDEVPSRNFKSCHGAALRSGCFDHSRSR